jgi:hypothetical protein
MCLLLHIRVGSISSWLYPAAASLRPTMHYILLHAASGFACTTTLARTLHAFHCMHYIADATSAIARKETLQLHCMALLLLALLLRTAGCCTRPHTDVQADTTRQLILQLRDAVEPRGCHTAVNCYSICACGSCSSISCCILLRCAPLRARPAEATLQPLQVRQERPGHYAVGKSSRYTISIKLQLARKT